MGIAILNQRTGKGWFRLDNANPWEARRTDPAEDLQRFCKERKDDIRKVGEIALKRAVGRKNHGRSNFAWSILSQAWDVVAISVEESKEVTEARQLR
jgi:hypothetical protein